MKYLLLFLLPLVYAAWSPNDILSPDTHPTFCHRYDVDASWICNPDDVLSNNVCNWFDETAWEISKNNTCDGFQVASAWINKMDLNGESVESASKRFATTIHDNWGVGDPECQNGVLLFLSIEDRHAYISIGKGVEDLLTSGHIQNVIDVMKPYLKSEEYDEALTKGMEKMKYYLEGNKKSNIRL